MHAAWPELWMYVHASMGRTYTNTQINKSITKKADQPKIRFTIKQHRNHLTTAGCVMQSIPNVPGRSNAAKKFGPACSSLDLSSACIYALCKSRRACYHSQKKAIQHHLGFASMQKALPALVLSVQESHGKHIGRRG